MLTRIETLLVAANRWLLIALMAVMAALVIANAVESHKVLLDAVAAGDIDAACALLVEHVLENEPRYRAACNVA